MRTGRPQSAWRKRAIAARGARALFGVDDAHADWLEYEDRAAGVYRAVHLVDDRIENCVFLSARPDLPAREWLASPLFAKGKLDDADRIGVLSAPVDRQGRRYGADHLFVLRRRAQYDMHGDTRARPEERRRHHRVSEGGRQLRLVQCRS